jgi:hypothetical protein
MTTTLYDLSVPTFLQTTRAIVGVLSRATKHCAETGADPDDFVHARLYSDMAPFHFQIVTLKEPFCMGAPSGKDRRVRSTASGGSDILF